MPVRDVEMVSIPVSDQDRAERFYSEVLGMEVVEDATFGNGMRWLQVRSPGAATSLTLVTWFPSMPAGSTRGLVLRVDDIEATAAELEAKGVGTSTASGRCPGGGSSRSTIRRATASSCSRAPEPAAEPDPPCVNLTRRGTDHVDGAGSSG